MCNNKFIGLIKRTCSLTPKVFDSIFISSGKRKTAIDSSDRRGMPRMERRVKEREMLDRKGCERNVSDSITWIGVGILGGPWTPPHISDKRSRPSTSHASSSCEKSIAAVFCPLIFKIRISYSKELIFENINWHIIWY